MSQWGAAGGTHLLPNATALERKRSIAPLLHQSGRKGMKWSRGVRVTCCFVLNSGHFGSFPVSATKKNPMCKSGCAWNSQLTGFLQEIFLAAVSEIFCSEMSTYVKCCHELCREVQEDSNIFLTEWVQRQTAHHSNTGLDLCTTFEDKEDFHALLWTSNATVCV